MLGDELGTITGEMTGMRVLSTDGGHAVVETSFRGTSTLLGADMKDMGTYESVSRPDGTLFGEGHGVSMTRAGDTVTWHGSGVGRFTESGGVSWRGALFYETASTEFTRLNGIAALFEFETEESGKVSGTLYEWK
ncbi:MULTISPECIES: hypothetical protein [Streptomyces]|jgi:hypothetical protein|uniref:DUF3224 domain-containing protein n=1 Tax=Streptomyces nymphaeiformis TaxID=2663842 RepID=A0A7W7TWD3_9ACTN|nr:hypothetical protein [Streptomyces nymphaeiformis]MBB4979752.1 hypothetical protein [Streptomyces nymphaeiformis]